MKSQRPPELTNLKRLPLIFGVVSVMVIIVLFSTFYPTEIWVLEDEVVHVNCNKERVCFQGFKSGRGCLNLKYFTATTRKGYLVTAKTCPSIQVGETIKFKVLQSRADSEASYIYIK